MLRQRASRMLRKSQEKNAHQRTPSRIVVLPWRDSEDSGPPTLSLDYSPSFAEETLEEAVSCEPLFQAPFLYGIDEYPHQHQKPPELPQAVFVMSSDMEDSYYYEDDNISVYSIHDAAVRTSIEIVTCTKPKLVHISPSSSPSQSPRRGKHFFRSRASSDSDGYQSSADSSVEGASTSRASTESMPTPASSVPTAPASPAASYFMKLRHRKSSESLTKLAAKYGHSPTPSMYGDAQKMIPRGATERAPSIELPPFPADGDIDELLNNTSKPFRRSRLQRRPNTMWFK